MPSISQPQWDAIGRKAAAVAREVTNRILREELSKLTAPIVNLTLQFPEDPPVVIDEQAVWRAYGVIPPKTRAELEAENDAGKCRVFTQSCDPGFSGFDFHNSESFASKPLPRPKPVDGDWFLVGGEKFTWWLGQWRRDSELEGFASWLKRKGFTAK